MAVSNLLPRCVYAVRGFIMVTLLVLSAWGCKMVPANTVVCLVRIRVCGEQCEYVRMSVDWLLRRGVGRSGAGRWAGGMVVGPVAGGASGGFCNLCGLVVRWLCGWASCAVRWMGGGLCVGRGASTKNGQ